MAGDFAEAIGIDRRLGEWAGWLHDLGKYSDEFQRHRLCLNPDGTPIANPERNRVEHAAYGAVVALDFQREVAAAIEAHHAGLSANSALDNLRHRDELTFRDAKPVAARAALFLERAKADDAFPELPSASLPSAGGALAQELRTRMLLSCLVDADRLDAECWVNGKQHELRTVPLLEPATRLENVLRYIEERRAGAITAGTSPDVVEARQEVLEACLQAAGLAPGFFSLTVPTGGAKTLASFAFALRHAELHGKRRVIVVAPFLAIIEQNAKAMRDALGDGSDELVLEHHSQADETNAGKDDGDQSLAELRRQLLAENWDVPVVITTTVQFFESLFSDRPGRVRKVHNIAGSVIIFDEAQTFPPGILKPLVGMLQQLVDEYDCTVVFATATQPALSHRGLRESLITGAVREITPDPAALFERLKRVEIDWSRARTKVPLADIAAEMVREEQALAIVNTTQQARELFRALRQHDSEAVHISGRMCPAHRLNALDRVRGRLEAGGPVRVASTTGIEAGVDVDFSHVWLAMAGLDAIAQAAGRCNRGGRLDRGHMAVFEPEDGKAPPGVYEAGRHVTRNLLPRSPGQPYPSIDSPEDFRGFFRRLYNITNLDSQQIVARREQRDFEKVAELRIINDDTVSVIVPWGDAVQIIADLQGDPARYLTRELRRKLERYSVTLYRPQFEVAAKAGWVVEAGGVWVVANRDHYDPDLGLVFPNDEADAGG